MSYPDPFPPIIPQQFTPNGDASDCWPQFHLSNEYSDPQPQFEQQPPLKRPRSFEENQSSDSTPYPPPIIPKTPYQQNAPLDKGQNNIFFKTRLCAKFKLGQCRNGENCNFAHGIEDMRQPPLNWQQHVTGRGDDSGTTNWDDDQRIIHKMKLCKKFYNGEECPYGEKCNFLHEEPKRFKDDLGKFRESSAISIGTTGPTPSAVNENVLEQVGNNFVNNSNNNHLDGFRGNMRPVYWKTKLCHRYDTTGHCPFAEKCHFAHGHAELQMYQHGGRVEGETGIPALTFPTNPINTAPSNNTITVAATSIQERLERKWKGFKKLNGIYADWIDDLPLVGPE